MSIPFALIMDIILLLALAVTIFYAVRLSNSLNAFKANKSEFDATVQALSTHIEQAYDAIAGLKESSGQVGDDLQDSISDAKYMVDELRQVNEVSDGLAHRLEVLAQKGRQTYVPVEKDYSADDAPSLEKEETVLSEVSDESLEQSAPEARSWKDTLGVSKVNDDNNGAGNSIFSIRDREFESDASQVDDFTVAGGGDDKEFSSQAEKDLYEALKMRQRDA